MKQLIILFAAAMILSAAVNAQTDDATIKSNEVAVKSDLASLNQKEKLIKNEKAGERKELRKLKETEVRYQSREEFFRNFGDVANASWERNDNFDEVTFTKDGLVKEAYYDIDSKLVGTTMTKSFEDLPAEAQKFINKKYKGYTKGKVIFFDDNERNDTDMVLFGSVFDDEDTYFVELKNDDKAFILRANLAGDVNYFRALN